MSLWGDCGRRFGDETHGQRRIDRGGLARLKIREAFHVSVESLTNFFHCGFRCFHMVSPTSLWPLVAKRLRKAMMTE